MSSVTLKAVEKNYGTVAALRTLNLEIAQGEFLTLLGPSGCGKTTTLRLIAGFVEPSAGRILFGGDDVTELPPQKREIGMVFQDYALFPHMTIADNIGFALVERGLPRERIRNRVGELLDLIRLPSVGDRFPAQLSGGQQQRVAVARAVAHSPRVLLMDEPLGALDLKLREAMQTEIGAIQRALGITTVYVTHDQAEAMSMSDRIAVMNDGRIEQMGSASEIYDRPSTRFVADFVGQINLIQGEVRSLEKNLAVVIAGANTLRAISDGSVHGHVTIGVRPEQIRLTLTDVPASPGDNALVGTVVRRQFAGNSIKIEVDIGTSTLVTVEAHPNAAAIQAGAQVRLTWHPQNSVILAR